MRALTCQGKHDVRVETVADPKIVNPRDAIIKITSTDLRLGFTSLRPLHPAL